MNYKNLGKTGLKVSSICLGTMTYGTQVAEADAIKLIKGSLDAGINFLDTAPIYSGTKSEEIVGKAIKGDRHFAIIATKVGPPTLSGGPGKTPLTNDGGLSRKNVMKALEDSLRRLQTDYVDLYYAHEPDYDTPLEETLRAFDDMVHQGKVRYLGCSNVSAWYASKAIRVSEAHDLFKYECIQPPYNLLTRDIETELLPFCDDEGLGVCTYNPLAGEILTGRHEFGKAPAEGRFTIPGGMGDGYLQRYWSENNFKALEILKQLAQARGVTLPQFSLAWVLNNPSITSVLSGSISMEQLTENLAALNIKLTEEELKKCDEVWQMFRPKRYSYFRVPGKPIN